MKNPCDNCIVKVTCTSICNEKENFEALVETAIYQNTIHSRTGIPGSTNFVKYAQMRNKNVTDSMTISVRKYKKEGGEDDPISRKVRQGFNYAQRIERSKHDKSDL